MHLPKTIGGLATLAAAVALIQSPVAQAGPAIGIDPTGSGGTTDAYFYADVLSDNRDSAIAIGYIPPPPIPALPYDIRVVAQMPVGGITLNGNPTNPYILNPAAGTNCDSNVCFQMTKVLDFQERVESVTLNGTTQTATFGLGSPQPADVDGGTAGNQQFAIYLNRITGDPAAGVTYDPNGATGYTDGTLVLSGHIVSNTASFTFDTATGIGTGSVNDVGFEIDYANTAYIDLDNPGVPGTIFKDIFQGSTNIPPFYSPTQMWDGTAVADNILFTVDSSENFLARSIPEPASIALLGLGLLGLPFGRRLGRSTRASC
jgi:hypothetical protein